KRGDTSRHRPLLLARRSHNAVLVKPLSPTSADRREPCRRDEGRVVVREGRGSIARWATRTRTAAFYRQLDEIQKTVFEKRRLDPPNKHADPSQNLRNGAETEPLTADEFRYILY